MQGLPVILKITYLQSLNKALDLFIYFKFCKSDFYFLNGSKNCMVATYNFGSVYIDFSTKKLLKYKIIYLPTQSHQTIRHRHEPDCHLRQVCIIRTILVEGHQNIIAASTRANLSSGVCKQHRRRPACASAQSDQRLCYSRFV